MAGRGFHLKIEVDLQAITCPGVWLCPNGRVTLQTNTLNARVQSRRVSPAFPLVFNDKFKFKKLFTGVNTLSELQSRLENEYLYTELIQWSSPNSSPVVLATFETNLADLLYPAPCFKGLLAGSEVDLLMEPTKYFPGILAPKIEVSTRTIIEEVIGICDMMLSETHVNNTKVIPSKNSSCAHKKRPSKGIIRQRQVCHTQGETKSQPIRPSRHKHASPDRTPPSSSSASHHRSEWQNGRYRHKSSEIQRSTNYLSSLKNREISPFRHSCHVLNDCPVCSQYKCYFSRNCESQISDSSGEQRRGNMQKIYESSKCWHDSRAECENDCENRRPRSAPHRGSLQDVSTSSMPRVKTTEMSRKNDKSNYVAGDTSEVDYFACERDQGRQGFYKNLEKFYKRMYKQAKIRAQEVG